jgi:hypothetical protein
MADSLQTGTAGALVPLRFASFKRDVMDKRCDGQHDIYVAEVFYVEAEGKAVVVTVCRQCDSVQFHSESICEPHRAATLLKGNNK